jgi:putative hydrolase of the HAD superfamily
VFSDVWQRIEMNAEAVDIVRELRRFGYGVHLGTNQERHRGTYMREMLGYEELFDVICYSFELKTAKPDPAFFVAAADRIGAIPSAILFVDDRGDNVDAARSVGMRAVQWHLDHGHELLRSLLRDAGIPELTPS